MFEISFFAGELIYTIIWLALRAAVWIKYRNINPKHELVLLLMYINLFVIIRFVFYPMQMIDGEIQPMMIDSSSILPLHINAVPFVNILKHNTRRELMINIIGNIAMFIPSGIIIPIIYKKADRFWKVTLIGVLITFFIESFQLLISSRTSDVDDIILNTAGVIVGYVIYAVIRFIRNKIKSTSVHY